MRVVSYNIQFGRGRDRRNDLARVAEADPGASAERALGLARTVTEQAETLQGEVTRFLMTTNNT